MSTKNERPGVVVMLDHQLGSAREVDGRAVGIDLTPAATVALRGLRDQHVAVVLLVERLEAEDVYATPAIEFDAVMKRGDDLKAALRAAADRLEMGSNVFVAGDRVQRGIAAAAGWTPLPHVAAASAHVAGRQVSAAWLSGRSDARRLGWLLPYEFSRTERGWSAIALVDERTIAQGAVQDVTVVALDFDVGTDDLLRVHLDGREEDDLPELQRRRIVRSEGGVAWLALGPEDDVADVQLHGRHGHVILLAPRPELLDEPVHTELGIERTTGHLPERYLELMRVVDLDLDVLRRWYCSPNAATYGADVQRYSGAAPLDAAGSIASRHVQHPDNGRVVDALLTDLRNMGYCAYTHTFSYGGSTFSNVIADLPGRGRLVIHHEWLDRIRAILRARPWPDPLWRKELRDLLGTTWSEDLQLSDLDDRLQRVKLEAVLGLRAWWPWWLSRCRAPGFGANIVLVGCHLDSTAANDPGFDPSTDPAPGADDDASGIAAVLAAARYLRQFRGQLTHTVRFAFFNAEEVGLVGSGAYASKLKGDAAPLTSVICADMMGYNSDEQRIFEIHAGAADPLIRDKSVPIGNLLMAKAAAQGRLGAGQLYSGTSWPPPGASDRTLYDGAINRSDHASFQAQGYGAVVVSEDFFVNLPSEPWADPNPNYHRSADTTIDAAYGADIACAISAAARELAQ